jgi:hypothetical protein
VACSGMRKHLHQGMIELHTVRRASKKQTKTSSAMRQIGPIKASVQLSCMSGTPGQKPVHGHSYSDLVVTRGGKKNSDVLSFEILGRPAPAGYQDIGWRLPGDGCFEPAMSTSPFRLRHNMRYARYLKKHLLISGFR